MSKLMIVEVPSYSCEFKGIREVRELITCKECCKQNTEDCAMAYWDSQWGEYLFPSDDDFCSQGSKKE